MEKTKTAAPRTTLAKPVPRAEREGETQDETQMTRYFMQALLLAVCGQGPDISSKNIASPLTVKARKEMNHHLRRVIAMGGKALEPFILDEAEDAVLLLVEDGRESEELDILKLSLELGFYGFEIEPLQAFRGWTVRGPAENIRMLAEDEKFRRLHLQGLQVVENEEHAASVPEGSP
jgi:hypothetical protein